MYTKIFIALTPDQIKLVNASALAKTFECTSSYISRTLKLSEEPHNEKQKNILKAAHEILHTYQSIPTETHE